MPDHIATKPCSVNADTRRQKSWPEICDWLERESQAEKRAEDLQLHPWKEALLPNCRGLALLPVGAGKLGKAPVDLKTGLALKSWQSASYSPEQIAGLNGYVRGLGFRPGPDSGHIATLDIDGASAKAFCEAHGCDFEAVGWRTGRDNSTDRLKVHFRIPEQLRGQLQGADGQPIGKRVLIIEPPERLELFYGTGQCVIAGQHYSGGHYVNHGHPGTVTEPDQLWMAVIREVIEKGTTVDAKPAADRSAAELVQSGPSTPCPVCGRNTSSACTVFVDGDRRRVNCFIGETFAPLLVRDGGNFLGELPLEVGATVPGMDGGMWAYVGRGTNTALGGEFATFVEDRPLSKKEDSECKATKQPKQSHSYRGLLKDCLEAIVEDDEDRYMQRVADMKNLYRMSDEQIQSRLLRLHMKSKVKKAQATTEGVDLDQIEQLEYAMDGWIPKGAVRMTYGSSGTGKTTLCVWTAHNYAQGRNILDREESCPPGKALFIATDSGAGPLKKALADLGIDPKDDLLWRPGPQQRIWVWAHAPEQGHEAWLADIRGLIRLETFIKCQGITYVVIDSAKSTTADVFSYTSNESVKSLMRYIQCCICEPLSCCIDWINHDGTEKGAAAGAKAWREDPSMVVRLTEEKDEDRQIGVRVQFVKDRAAVIDPKRTLVYALTEGALELAPDVEVVGSCEEQILELLWEQHCATQGAMRTAELKQEALLRFDTAGKTVENTVARMWQARPAKVVRPRRGVYALAPAEIERRQARVIREHGHAAGSSIRLSTLWGGKDSDPLQQNRSTNTPPTPRRGESGGSHTHLVTEPNPPEPPEGDWPGGSQNPDGQRDLGKTLPMQVDTPHREALARTREELELVDRPEDPEAWEAAFGCA